MNPLAINRLRERLQDVIGEHGRLLEQFNTLAHDPRVSTASLEALQRRITRQVAEQTRLLSQLRLTELEAPERLGSFRALAGQRPLRDDVLETIHALGVPAAPRAVSEVALAVLGRPVPADRIASLRRDEERAYRRNPLSRPDWLLPAISAAGLSPLPRLVTSSTWEPERRLIGARTLRANHLRTLLRLIDLTDRPAAADGERAAAQREMLIRRYAESVPGALAPGTPIDLVRIREAAEAELAVIDPSDQAERQAAARLLAELPEPQRFWGRVEVVPGGLHERRSLG